MIEFLIRENFDPQLGAQALRKAVELHLRGAVVNSLFGVGSPHGWVVCDSTFLKIEPIGPAA